LPFSKESVQDIGSVKHNCIDLREKQKYIS
jgi:hypothetical protein